MRRHLENKISLNLSIDGTLFDEDLPEIMYPGTPPSLLRNKLSHYSPLPFVQIGRITFSLLFPFFWLFETFFLTVFVDIKTSVLV